jgi:hypothetical protein
VNYIKVESRSRGDQSCLLVSSGLFDPAAGPAAAAVLLLVLLLLLLLWV